MKAIKLFECVTLYTEEELKKRHIPYDKLAPYFPLLGTNVLMIDYKNDEFICSTDDIAIPKDIINSEKMEDSYSLDTKYCVIETIMSNDGKHLTSKKVTFFNFREDAGAYISKELLDVNTSVVGIDIFEVEDSFTWEVNIV